MNREAGRDCPLIMKAARQSNSEKGLPGKASLKGFDPIVFKSADIWVKQSF